MTLEVFYSLNGLGVSYLLFKRKIIYLYFRVTVILLCSSYNAVLPYYINIVISSIKQNNPCQLNVYVSNR